MSDDVEVKDPGEPEGVEKGRKAGKPLKPRKGKPRWKKFVEKSVTGMNDRVSALEAGFADSTALHTKEKLWSRPDVQAYYQEIVQGVVPPERITKLLNELLEGKSITVHQKQARVQSTDGTTSLQVVSEMRTVTVDRNIQLRTLGMVAEHGGLIPSSVRAATISPASLEEVLERAEKEYIKHGDMMTPSWLLEREKLLAMENGTEPEAVAVETEKAPEMPVAETPTAEAAEQPTPEQPVDACDACGKARCEHGRCPACEMCESCEQPVVKEP